MSHCLQWFIGYWDRVVDVWLDKPLNTVISKGIYANRPLGKGKEDYYKDDHLTVNIEIDQLPWFENENIAKLLCPIHMPEPYWGNPNDCSIVIINYNPGGGMDMSPHTYKGKGAPYPDNTMIEYVNRKNYSALASDFPLLKTTEELEQDERWWLRSYGGRKWWLRKKEWIQHLVQAWKDSKDEQSKGKETECSEDVICPFAIELCGWHSHNWNDSTANITGNNDIKKEIQEYFIYPLLQSIENSTTQLAVCIGKLFNSDIFCFLPKGKTFIDITQTLCSNINVCSDNNTYKVEYNETEGALKVEAEGKSKPIIRYYRIYNIKHNNRSHIVINTWVQGSNHHPAEHFWPFETELIKAIEKYKTT